MSSHRSKAKALASQQPASTIKSHHHHRSSSVRQATPNRSSNNRPGSSNNRDILFLKQSDVKFERPTQQVSVFFDECNREIITLTGGLDSKTKVVFQATEQPGNRVQFLLPVDKRILSIKFNSSRTALAYHVENSNVEFINVKAPATVAASDADASGAGATSAALQHQQQQPPATALELEERRYVQSTRTKNSKLLGFLWTGPMELVMITDISIEYYHVEAPRYRLRHIKSFQSSTNWFVYQPPPLAGSADDEQKRDKNGDRPHHHHSVLMVSTGSIGNSIQPYLFARGQVIKMQRFDVEGNWHGSEKLELFERSITMASIYGCVRLLVLQHESLDFKSRGAQILIYTVDNESGLTNKTHTLDLDISGKFAINILDNLIVAHDQPSKSSFIFDIMIESTEKSDCPQHFVSLIDSQPLRPMRLEGKSEDVEMYSLNWVFFQPNFIIDAKMGLLLTLHIDLMVIQAIIQDNLMLLDFLAHREHSEQIILSKCRLIVADAHQIATGRSQRRGNPLVDVSSTFELLGKLVISAPELDRRHTTDSIISNSTNDTKYNQATIIKMNNSERLRQCYAASIAQEDVYRDVFRQLETMDCKEKSEDPAHLHFVMSTLLEFIFIVRKLGKNVEFCIYEQLIKCLVRGKRFYQIVLMIRSEIFKDSKQLACLLLSLRNQYPPAGQLGLDMLHRLNCLTDFLIDISIDKNMS